MLGSMMSPKMIAGMVSGLITDDNIKKLDEALAAFVEKKQAEHGPAAKFQVVIEPTEDNKHVRILLWLTPAPGVDPVLLFNQVIGDCSAEQLKNLIKDYAG